MARGQFGFLFDGHAARPGTAEPSASRSDFAQEECARGERSHARLTGAVALSPLLDAKTRRAFQGAAVDFTRAPHLDAEGCAGK